MKQNNADELWYQVLRKGYGMAPALVSQPLLGLEAAEKRLLQRQAAEHDAGYSYNLVSCAAPAFQHRSFPRRKRSAGTLEGMGKESLRPRGKE